MAKYAYVIDMERCMGCYACVEACKVENNTGRGIYWMYVFRLEMGKYPNVNWQFMPRPCMHCDNAPCVKVCPVGARFKRDDGEVLVDFNRCIGCRYCIVACPYSVNHFNWKKPARNQYFDWKVDGRDEYGTGGVQDEIGDAIPPYKNPDHQKLYGLPGQEKRLVAGSGHYLGVTEKCTWCVHRLDKGLVPACVANCPAFVLNFGDLNDPNSTVSRLLAKKPSFRLLEELGTEPSVYYIGRPPPTEAARQQNMLSHKAASEGK